MVIDLAAARMGGKSAVESLTIATDGSLTI
jgi:hypothetical protein